MCPTMPSLCPGMAQLSPVSTIGHRRQGRQESQTRPGHDTGTDRHAVGERPGADLERVPDAVPAVTAPGANGHVPEYGSGAEPGHQAGQSGHHGPVRAGRVPDCDILAWLREQAGTTVQVPGHRKVIDKWALGSPRADRLRRIVRAEAARSAAAASAG
jgi:hypothetical protein